MNTAYSPFKRQQLTTNIKNPSYGTQYVYKDLCLPLLLGNVRHTPIILDNAGLHSDSVKRPQAITGSLIAFGFQNIVCLNTV